MRVKVEVTVDVDPEAWDLEYGTGPGTIREDVKVYCAQLVLHHLNDLGVLLGDDQ